jgi:UDP-N-acetylglucosamine diphosphorylase/glucosamine-1-phosphate N-acetyltransferase
MANDIAVIILAAGLGTRMCSDKAKVLHEICGRPLISHVADAAFDASLTGIIAVVGHQAEEVQRCVRKDFSDIRFALQPEQLGTGHAVQCALGQLRPEEKDVLILCGDVPLITSQTLLQFVGRHRELESDVTVMAVTTDTPKGYGRLVVDRNGQVQRIVEEADASPEQKAIRTVNAGIYCVAGAVLKRLLAKIGRNNAQGEMYLTDIVEIGNREGCRIGAYRCHDSREVIGVNSIEDLQHAEKIMKTGVFKKS